MKGKFCLQRSTVGCGRDTLRAVDFLELICRFDSVLNNQKSFRRLGSVTMGFVKNSRTLSAYAAIL